MATPYTYDTDTYGPQSGWMDLVLNTNAQGAPNLDTSDPAYRMPMVPGAKPTVQGGFAQQVFRPQQQSPAAPPQQGAPQGVPTLQDQQGELNYPKVPQPYNLPARQDIGQITQYKSAFDRFPALTHMLQDPNSIGADSSGPQTPWTNPNLPPILQQLTYGLASPQQRQYYGQIGDQSDTAHLKKMKAIGDLMQAAAGASADDQQGLERNTAAYGNVAKAYNEMNTEPHIQHSIDMQAQQRQGSGEASAALANQRTQRTPTLMAGDEARALMMGQHGDLYGAQASQTNALTEPKIYATNAQGDQRESAAGLSDIRGQAVQDEEPHVINRIDSTTDLNKKRAGAIGKSGKNGAAGVTLEQVHRQFLKYQQDLDGARASAESDDSELSKAAKAAIPKLAAKALRAQQQWKDLGGDDSEPVVNPGDGNLISAKEDAPPMPADPKDLKEGQTYTNKNGKRGKYKGNGQWQLLQ